MSQDRQKSPSASRPEKPRRFGNTMREAMTRLEPEQRARIQIRTRAKVEVVMREALDMLDPIDRERILTKLLDEVRG